MCPPSVIISPRQLGYWLGHLFTDVDRLLNFRPSESELAAGFGEAEVDGYAAASWGRAYQTVIVVVHQNSRFPVAHTSCGQVGPSVVELISLAFGPRVEMTNVYDDLTIWSYFHLGTVHRPRSRTFEVNFLAVVAGALEFVLGWLPIGSAA